MLDLFWPVEALLGGARGEILGPYPRPSRAQPCVKDVSIDQERKSQDRTGLDTPIVATVNDANREFVGVNSMTRRAPDPGNREFLGSGGSMVAKLKLKGIDGRAPPGVEPAA